MVSRFSTLLLLLGPTCTLCRERACGISCRCGSGAGLGKEYLVLADQLVCDCVLALLADLGFAGAALKFGLDELAKGIGVDPEKIVECFIG